MSGDDRAIEIPLVGPGGEPVDLWRTFNSHGVADLPPMALDEGTRVLEVTLPVHGARPRTVRIGAGSRGHARAEIVGAPAGPALRARLADGVRHVLGLDQDLSGFYEIAAADPELAWATSGAGRMIRSPTVFEEVVKTICTTNVAWSATVRMVTALVENLGTPAPGAPRAGWRGRAFPTPAAMAGVGEGFYREVVRAGYRAAYLLALARDVAERRLELEDLGRLTPADLPDEEMRRRLLALPGVGPYAAAHVMLMLGRTSHLILDSWTRPTYARLRGVRGPVSDATILRRFRRYGGFAGLAFWLYLTRGWVPE